MAQRTKVSGCISLEFPIVSKITAEERGVFNHLFPLRALCG
jgi:hypothetical protein